MARRNDFQTAVRMPSELYEQLQAAAGDHSINEEIRRRLEASFADAPPAATDPKTAEFLAAVVVVARRLSQDFAAWHEDRFAFEVLRHALDTILVRGYRPDGEPVAKPNPAGMGWAHGDNPKVEDVARVEAGIALEAVRKAREDRP